MKYQNFHPKNDGNLRKWKKKESLKKWTHLESWVALDSNDSTVSNEQWMKNGVGAHTLPCRVSRKQRCDLPETKEISPEPSASGVAFLPLGFPVDFLSFPSFVFPCLLFFCLLFQVDDVRFGLLLSVISVLSPHPPNQPLNHSKGKFYSAGNHKNWKRILRPVIRLIFYGVIHSSRSYGRLAKLQRLSKQFALGCHTWLFWMVLEFFGD